MSGLSQLENCLYVYDTLPYVCCRTGRTGTADGHAERRLPWKCILLPCWSITRQFAEM